MQRGLSIRNGMIRCAARRSHRKQETVLDFRDRNRRMTRITGSSHVAEMLLFSNHKNSSFIVVLSQNHQLFVELVRSSFCECSFGRQNHSKGVQ